MSRARAPIRLPIRRRLALYATALGLWLSGAGWLLLRYFGRRSGAFGPEPQPLEPWALKLHGAFAFAAIAFAGLLWGVHVSGAWAARRRRTSGALLAAAILALILTGWLLYYAGDETARAWISPLHWILGLAAPAAFLAHRFAPIGVSRPARTPRWPSSPGSSVRPRRSTCRIPPG